MIYSRHGQKIDEVRNLIILENAWASVVVIVLQNVLHLLLTGGLRIAKKSFSPIKKPTREKILWYAIFLAISNSHMLKMFSRSLFRPKAFVFSRIVKSQQGDFYVMPRKCFLRSIFTIGPKSLWKCILGIFAFTNYFLSLQYI